MGNRLLGLYSLKDSPDGEAPDDTQDAARGLEVIASYLLPLRLTDERHPVEEHARLAAESIRQHG